MMISIKKPDRPQKPIGKKFFVFSEVIYRAFVNKFPDDVELLRSIADLSIFLKNEPSNLEMYLIFDTIKMAKNKLNDINKVLTQNNLNNIVRIQEKIELNENITCGVFGIESSDRFETLIDAISEQYHDEAVEQEYYQFYEKLKSINKKPKNGKKNSYKIILPALYEELFIYDGILPLVRKNYSSFITSFESEA